jgi:hypothetical protein
MQKAPICLGAFLFLLYGVIKRVGRLRAEIVECVHVGVLVYGRVAVGDNKPHLWRKT